jgi:hypothetical protein
MYEINLTHDDGTKECLGHMEERHVTYNRYNEGLLIGAGKLHGSSIRRAAFLEHGARYRNKAQLEFKGKDKAFQGVFCFINFIPESHTVVFGSIGPVYEWCPLNDRPLSEDDITPPQPVGPAEVRLEPTEPTLA